MKEIKSIWLAFLAITLTIATLWHTNRDAVPEIATFDDVLKEAKTGGFQNLYRLFW